LEGEEAGGVGGFEEVRSEVCIIFFLTGEDAHARGIV
jgi:hypothetical protein